MCQTIWFCFLGCVHVNVWIYRKAHIQLATVETPRGTGHSEWPTKVKGTGSEIPPGGVVFRGARDSPKYLHQNWIISSPKYMRVLKKKKSPPKKNKQTKRKGSGSKTCPFFNGGSGSLFGIKAHIAFRIAAPCHPPTPPTCPTTWMRSGAIFRAKAKSVGKTLGVGRR